MKKYRKKYDVMNPLIPKYKPNFLIISRPRAFITEALQTYLKCDINYKCIIYIGEGEDGSCAPNEFFDLLDIDYSYEPIIEGVYRKNNMWDELRIYNAL